METRDLQIFRAVYESGGFARAGQRMNTVQSNISARIKHLEEVLGNPLFRRNRRMVEATEAGHRLYDYAGRILALEAEMRHSVAAPGMTSGRLRIGAMETTTAVRLPPYLTEFHHRHPEIAMDLQTGPSMELIQAVCDCRLDAAFIGGVAGHPALTHRKIFDEELVLVAADAGAFDDLASQPILVFRAGCGYRRHLEVYLASRNVFPARIMEMGTLEGILGCVAAGMGITMLPRSVTRQAHLRGRLVEQSLPPAMGRLATNLILRKEDGPSAALKAFLSVLPIPEDAPESR